MSKYRGVLYVYTVDPNLILTGVKEEVAVERATSKEIQDIFEPYTWGNYQTGTQRLLPVDAHWAWEIFDSSKGRVTNSHSSNYSIYEQMVEQRLGLPPRVATLSHYYIHNSDSDSVWSKRVMFYSPVPLSLKEWLALERRAKDRHNLILEMRKVERINLATQGEQNAFAQGIFAFVRYFFSVNGCAEVPMATNYS